MDLRTPMSHARAGSIYTVLHEMPLRDAAMKIDNLKRIGFYEIPYE